MTIKKLPILLGLFLLITGVPSAAKFYTDWLWFKELGYESVFLRSLSAQALVGESLASPCLRCWRGTSRSHCEPCAPGSSSSIRSTARRRSG